MTIHFIDVNAEMEGDYPAMTFQDIKKLQQTGITVNLSSDLTVPLREMSNGGIALREYALSYDDTFYWCQRRNGRWLPCNDFSRY